MSYFLFAEERIAPGAKERIGAKLKDIPKINEERPCYKCEHYFRYKLIRCRLPFGRCDFYHSAYKPTTGSVTEMK